MANDERDILELFYEELDFIKRGGYGRPVKTPWKPTSVFQDSLSCLNYGYSDNPHPCSGCHLIDFVPVEARGELVPCHHIPLNATGETIESLEAGENQQRKEESVKGWLRERIKQIKDAPAVATV